MMKDLSTTTASHFEIDVEVQKDEEADSTPLTGQGSDSSCCNSSCLTKTLSVILIVLGIVITGGSIIVTKKGAPYVGDMFKGASTVCSQESNNYPGWESNFDSSVANYQKLTMFHVSNAASFYEGGKAEVEEVGPFVYQCWKKKLNVEFTADQKFVSFQEYQACEFVPSMSCSDCHEGRTFVNPSPGYAKVLTNTVNEGMLFLKSAGCSSRQLKAIGEIDPTDTSKHPVDWKKGVTHPDNANRGCCLPDVAMLSSPYQNGEDTAVLLQNACILSGGCEYRSCTALINSVKPFLSRMNKYDGGVLTATTAHYSSAMVSKTVREYAYGYPFALGGWLGAGVVTDGKSLAETQLLLEKYDVGGTTFGELTRDVHKVCSNNLKLKSSGESPRCSCTSSCAANCVWLGTDTCSSACVAIGGGSCSCQSTCSFVCNSVQDDTCESECVANGVPDGDHGLEYEYSGLAEIYNATEMTGEGASSLKYLSGIQCEVGNDGVDAAAECINNDLDCICSDGSTITNPHQACCIAGPASMKGRGCLAWIPGWITPEKNRWNESDVYRWLADEPHYKTGTGCGLEEGEEDTFDEVIEYMDKTEGAIWFNGEKLPSPSDVQLFSNLQDPTSDSYDLSRFDQMGGKFNSIGGKKSPALRPMGLDERVWGSDLFSRGEPVQTIGSNHSFSIFLSYLFRGIKVVYDGESIVEGIPMARYKLNKQVLAATPEHKKEGIGIIEGTSVQTFKFQAPVLVSLPNFLDADYLLNQDEMLAVYRNYDYNDNYKKLSAHQLMTPPSVEKNRGLFETYLDIEPSTGKAMSGHSRLMGSLYMYNAPVDPTGSTDDDSYNAAFLFFNENLINFDEWNPSDGDANGYSIASQNPLIQGRIVGGFARSAANIFTPKLKPEIFIPAFWIDQTATIDEASAEKFLRYGSLLGLAERLARTGTFVGIAMFVFGLGVCSFCCCFKRKA